MSDSAGITSPGAITHNELEADITVDDTKKITGTSASTYFLMFRIKGDSEYADGINYGPPAFAPSSSGSSNIITQLFSGVYSLIASLNPLKIVNNLMTGDAEGKVKASAAYDALSGSDADFIAHPSYTYTKKNWIIIQQFEATVQGYAGKYSNIRSVDFDEIKFERDIERRVNEKIVKKLIIGDGLNK